MKPFDKLRASGAVVVTALLMSSCGAPLLKLPTGPGSPATDAAPVIAQAISACRAVRTITLEMGVHGSAGGHRLRGRLTAGLAQPASARLEAVAPFGQPVFVFVASGGDASLLLPRDRRVLEHGKPADVLEAITGVPLDAAQLRSLVTGCAASADGPGGPGGPDASDTVAFGENWRVAPDGADTLYFRRASASEPWRLVATARRNAWRAEYSIFENNLPRIVRLVSDPPGRFDLQLDLSQVELNVALGPEAFRLPLSGKPGTSATADPISLDELRRSGPLGEK